MKMPTLLTKKKKLHAATARRSRSLGLPEMEEMAEPNMKLSRALLIVLLLHIVAVAGIVAFNTIKTRENFAPETPEALATPSAAPSVPATTAATTATVAPNESAKVATTITETKTSTAEEPVASQTKNSIVKDSGKIYTVVRGDNPVTIARHLKVSEADLLELNQITDPRKLQINQKLHIPERRSSTKTRGN